MLTVRPVDMAQMNPAALQAPGVQYAQQQQWQSGPLDASELPGVAIMAGQPVKEELEMLNPKKPDTDLLFSAILNNDSPACQELIEQGVCVNATDAVHDTPLVKLLRHHRSDADANSIVKQLIDAKADINALCSDGRCILELAIGAQHTGQQEARHGPHVYPASIALQLIVAGQLHPP